tara:strand:+ start:774 stop:926 length:153 start_codon:yes stop_codon:yes gene_type:complete
MNKKNYLDLVDHLFEANKQERFEIKNDWQEEVFEFQNNIYIVTKYFLLTF